MGQAIGFKCRNCGFEAELGDEQPYYTMSGSITDKYCPRIAEIITVFTSVYDGTTQISCQDEDWQEEFGDPALCRDCKRDCLKDLEMLADGREGDFFQGYKCPRCSSDLGMDCVVSFSCID